MRRRAAEGRGDRSIFSSSSRARSAETHARRASARARHPRGAGARARDRLECGLLDGEAELGREADRAKGPEAVLAEALEGVSYRADEPHGRVLPAAVGIDEAASGEVVGHGVHGEVTPGEVLLDGRRVGHGVGMPPVAVVGL
jgi:hypothetical protein